MVFFRKSFLCCFVLLLLLNTVFVFSGGNKDLPQKTIIAVSILPQSYFVNRISGGGVETLVLVGQGQDIHSYEPSPRQMADLSKAAVWILSKTDFEISLLPKIKKLYPHLKIVDGTEGAAFRYMDGHDHEEDDHVSHDQTEIDRHTWLGREPAKILARHVYETLKVINPENAGMYQTNYDALIIDIDDEFDRLQTALAPLRGKPVFVYHPSFGYFFDGFGIIQEAVETGGKEPGPKQITALITKAKAEQASAIFVQAEFPVETAKTIAAALGVNVLPMNALSADWLSNIRLMGETLMQGKNQ